MDSNPVIQMVDRKRDPNYGQVNIYIPKTLIKRFKKVCVDLELNQSEAGEQALLEWLDSKELGDIPDK